MLLHSEIISHLLFTFVYFFLITILRWGELGRLGILGLWAGAVLGTFFLDIDHLLYWFVMHPEKEDSKEAREIVYGRNRGTGGTPLRPDVRRDFAGQIRRIREITKELCDLLEKAHVSHTRLIFHSVVGQAILLILAFYLLTSGGSIFGSAFIMSINLHLLKDEWQDFFKDKNHLKDWLFWQVRGEITEKQLTVYLIGVTIVFLFLTRLVL